jgi:hypothetical protein
MAVTTTQTNKPLNPRGNDQSPKGYNRAELYSGKALDFDGVNDNIAFPLFNFTAGNKYTLCIYANRDNNGMIWSHSNQFVEIRFYGGAVQLRTYDTAWNIYTLIDDVSANEWHQIIVTYDVDANIWESYLNGQFVKSITAAAALYPRINRIGSTGGTFYDGEFSNAKIFDVALTAAQVADLYNNPEKVVPTGVADSALKLWLPMQEGAGTTAYDGSGNGNHGTISGATYTHGIGAPVSQTAVIDWNKKENLIIRSESIVENQVPGGWAQSSGDPLESSSEADPTSRNTASLINVESLSPNDYFYNYQTPVTSGEEYTFSIWAKLGTAENAVFVVNNTTAWDTVIGANYVATAANGYDEWKQLSITFTAPSTNKVNVHIGYHQETGVTQQDLGNFYLWGAALHKGSTPVLVPTFGTAQTSEVLLPQGLTTGRDITGVNLFENVRKQGALNLDGNSWAEVHDNASLDFGTGEFSLEAWVKVNYENQGSSYNSILTLGGSSTANTALNTRLGVEIRFYYNGSESKTSVTIGDWVHIVGTYDETNATLYLNGSQVDQDARTATNITNTSSKMIGHDTANNRHYPDQIAQPRIYNRALTAEEVARNYDAGKNIYTND